MAEWLLGWGVPFGVAGLIAIGFGLRPNAVLARSHSAAGAWAAVVVVAIQNLADLGSEIPGLVLAAVVCAAIVVAGSSGKRARWRIEEVGKAPKTLALVCAAAAVGGIALAIPTIKHSADAERSVLRAAALNPSCSREQMRALAHDAMLRHPGEPYFPFISAVRAVRSGDDDPLPWLAATFERAPLYGPAHLVFARMVSARVPSQARLEYRLAMDQDPNLTSYVLEEAPRLVRTFDDAMELVPQGSIAVDVLESLSTQLEPRLPATSIRLDAEHLRRAPTDARPSIRLARAAVQDVEAGESASWCVNGERQSCLTRALRATSHAEQLAPGRCEPYALHARAQAESGNGAKALSELVDASDLVSERVECLEALVELAYRMHDALRATETMARITKAGCAQDVDCARNFSWVAAIEEEHGNRQQALALYKSAYERVPDQDELLARAAHLAATIGLHAEAVDDFERLARRHPGNPSWLAAAENERTAAMREAINR